MVHSQIKAGIDQIFSQVGEDITYVTVTRSLDSEDDQTESTSESTVTAVVQYVGLDESQEDLGELEVGDAIAYFKEGTTVNKGDRIKHSGRTFKINRILPEYAGGEAFTMAFLQRIHE